MNAYPLIERRSFAFAAQSASHMPLSPDDAVVYFNCKSLITISAKIGKINSRFNCRSMEPRFDGERLNRAFIWPVFAVYNWLLGINHFVRG